MRYGENVTWLQQSVQSTLLPYSPPTLTAAGYQRTIPTNKGHFSECFSQRHALVATSAGTHRLLVARTSKCGWAINVIRDTCQKQWNLHKLVTLDDMMVHYKGINCHVRQYVLSRPRKLGLRIWALVDAEAWYVHNFGIYRDKRKRDARCESSKQRGIMSWTKSSGPNGKGIREFGSCGCNRQLFYI